MRKVEKGEGKKKTLRQRLGGTPTQEVSRMRL